MKRFPGVAVGALAVLGLGMALQQAGTVKLGKQADGTFMVSSGQRIEAGTLAFDGRPVDIAAHPAGKTLAVLGQNKVFLVTDKAVVAGSDVALGAGAGFHGLVWTPDGTRLFASVSNGSIQECLYTDGKLTAGRKLTFAEKGNPRPGGMAITRDGKTLFVALMDKDAVAEVSVETGKVLREHKTQRLPFTVALSGDEQTLIVSNWAGRPVTEADEEEKGERGESAGAWVVTDPRGFTATGSVSLLARDGSSATHLPVGLHPTAILVQGDRALVTNTMSDTLSVIDLGQKKVSATWPLTWQNRRLLGAMPTAFADTPALGTPNNGGRVFVACGGDNAVAEVDTKTGKILGYRPTGYYPMALAWSEGRLFVLNTKGNGSVRKTILGQPGNAHDFQGSVSVLDPRAALSTTTARVASLNGWDKKPERLTEKVFSGTIQHVLYIIKENRTYDEVFGDLPQGNGDPKLCGLGEEVTPNLHKLAREFTLFDNGYVSGTNSADGHQWTDTALANDYLEHMYTGYRTYPDDGDDPMGISSAGAIWDAALKKKKTVRVYGEFCDDSRNLYIPKPKDWLEMWQDRGIGRIKTKAVTTIPVLKPLIHPNYLYWPLYQSDQARADIFIDEYTRFSKENRVPNLMVMSLPCDHTEGLSAEFPKPKSMVADNDLALGRIVEAVSKSPQWKNTAIFVIEDDAQAGPDHVDGHRTVFSCYSPYTRRGFVDSNFYTTVTMLATIEKMLGLEPMNRFDANTPPMRACFTDTPDLTPYTATPNRIRLDDMNAPRTALAPSQRKWFDLSASLDWSKIDGADFNTLNRILWHELHGDKPYPIAAR